MSMIVLGIAGPSGAGKTFLAQAVLNAELAATTARLSLDNYYYDRSQLSPADRAAINFDEPEALDHRQLIDHLNRLRLGQTIICPNYDFHTHTRREDGKQISPVDLLIVEGLFILHWQELRDCLTMSVFVETPDILCLRRRLARDTRERGRTQDSIQQQYRTSVRAMAERYVLPTRRYADLVIAGNAPIADSVERIHRRLAEMVDSEERP